MKRYSDCGKQMRERQALTPEGVRYSYFHCGSCGEEIVDMKQLHVVAEKYRALKLYHAKMTQWGRSLGVRIPKPLVAKYHLKANREVSIVPEREGIRIVPKK